MISFDVFVSYDVDALYFGLESLSTTFAEQYFNFSIHVFQFFLIPFPAIVACFGCKFHSFVSLVHCFVILIFGSYEHIDLYLFSSDRFTRVNCYLHSKLHQLNS